MPSLTVTLTMLLLAGTNALPPSVQVRVSPDALLVVNVRPPRGWVVTKLGSPTFFHDVEAVSADPLSPQLLAEMIVFVIASLYCTLGLARLLERVGAERTLILN